MKKALVLCGGGSLGAYEMGAWRMLRELNMDFDIVVGTSIGAINGAVYATGDYDKAVELWKEIDVSKVMTNGMDLNKGFIGELDFKENSKLRRWLEYYFDNNGADIGPFKKIIEKTIDPKKVLASKKIYGVVTVEAKTLKECHIIMNEQKEEDILGYIYASSACFPIFPMHKMNGKTYIDGGYRNNMPVDFAFELGADEVVAVLLHSFPPIPQKAEYYRNVPNVMVIEPSLPQGSIMDFTSNRISDNEMMGYCDTGKAYGLFWGFQYTFRKDNAIKERAHRFYMEVIKKNGMSFYHNCRKMLKPNTKDLETEMDFYLINLERLARLYGLNPFRICTIAGMEKKLRKLMLQATSFEANTPADSAEKKFLLRMFIHDDAYALPRPKNYNAIYLLDIAFKVATDGIKE
ncbi:MAG: patatin-like phospholipase family protein [Bacilli bacterium]|nr:patatin-like phospholipase family protein [Bacilli bacterium]